MNLIRDIFKFCLVGESLNIWDEVLNGEFPSRRTWESLGKIDPAKSKPYLTELGPQGVHKAWIVAMENLRLVDPRYLQL